MAGSAPDIPNARSVQELLALFYGVGIITEPDESDYTIGTTAIALGGNFPGQRISRLLSNTGATNFAISYSPNVLIATGALILPGGTFSDDWYYDGDLLNRPLWAISSAGGGTLHMIERILVGG
jgi:hypothetical protein